MDEQHAHLSQLAEGVGLSGNLARDVAAFLSYHRLAHLIPHCADVAEEAANLALRFGENQELASQAGWLHDISAVIPSAQRAIVAKQWRLDVLPEEERFPLIVHQKLSVVIAREIFGVTEQSVLNAIGCHTTLKANPAGLDKVLFVADKVRWDQAGTPPYYASMLTVLEISLDEAVFCYLSYMWQRRQELKVVHPWLVAAYQQFSNGRQTRRRE